MTHRELAYVVGSRARQETHVFCDKSTVLGLSDQMSRSRANDMAHDHLPQQDLRHVLLQTPTV
jgi:hypothetical protein